MLPSIYCVNNVNYRCKGNILFSKHQTFFQKHLILTLPAPVLQIKFVSLQRCVKRKTRLTNKTDQYKRIHKYK